MIFRISRAADPCRPGTMWFRQMTFPSCEIKCLKSGESMCGEIKPKNWFSPPILNRSSSVKHGVAKLLTFYFTARGRRRRSALSGFGPELLCGVCRSKSSSNPKSGHSKTFPTENLIF